MGSMTISDVAGVVSAVLVRRGELRRVAVRPGRAVVLPPVVRLAVLVARRRAGAAFRVEVAAFLVAVEARRRVVAGRRARVPLAIWRACFVRLSMRLRTLLTSPRVLARLT